MDPDQYTTLAAALQAVPDPRQRYPWALLLTLIMAALVSGEQHGRVLASGARNTRPSWGSGSAGRVLASRVRPPCAVPCATWTWRRWRTA
jgi:hypothetical protein